jgi:glycosyltransferase involved in cell wall biosynthesis
VPATTQILRLVDAIHKKRIPVLFDVDDLIFDPDIAGEIPALQLLPPDEAELWMQGVRRYRTTLEACDTFIGSTPALCRHAADITGLPTEHFHNGIGVLLGRLSDAQCRRPRAPGPLRIGYLSGTITHDLDWRYIEPAVIRVLERHSEVELWLGGLITPSKALTPLADRVRRLPLLPWDRLPSVLRDLDVNLAPLAPASSFNEAKSAIKWLEAALVATPTVASPTEPFQEAIVHGVNGLLASGPEEWETRLEDLLASPASRDRMGQRARRDALLRWSPHLQAHRYLDILQRSQRLVDADGGAVSRSSQWEAVVLDEAPGPFVLEPYRVPSQAGPRKAWSAVRSHESLLATGKVLRRIRLTVGQLISGRRSRRS